MDDPWYELVEGHSLEQGDLIDRCPVYIPEYSTNVVEEEKGGRVLTYKVSGKTYAYNAVIMSQSCDLEQRHVLYVVLSAYFSLEGMISLNEKLRPKKMQEKIRKNDLHNYHMLDVCELEGMKRGIQVIGFRTTFTVPYDFLTQFAAFQGKRLRLRSPYKEDMSHRFGHFFSRVALPKGIAPFVF